MAILNSLGCGCKDAIKDDICWRCSYRNVFNVEREVDYPPIDAIESREGYALSREKYESAARVLACPIKDNPPNWQHGRVLYAVTRKVLAGCAARVLLLDIGTAKGYSALCLKWAAMDAGVDADVISVDVIDPTARVKRNTVAELEGLKTLTELLAPWPESASIRFLCTTGEQWLRAYSGRIRVAFVDGKHKYEAVSAEAALLRERQQTGDVILFDDVQIPGVRKAVDRLKGYDVEMIQILPNRAYALARKA